jgi:hypothetical protein
VCPALRPTEGEESNLRTGEAFDDRRETAFVDALSSFISIEPSGLPLFHLRPHFELLFNPEEVDTNLTQVGSMRQTFGVVENA